MAHELQQATANQSLLKCHPTLAVDSVQTEDVFCQVDSDCCNLHHWTLLPTSVPMVEFTILALNRPFQVVGLGPSHQYRWFWPENGRFLFQGEGSFSSPENPARSIGSSNASFILHAERTSY